MNVYVHRHCLLFSLGPHFCICAFKLGWNSNLVLPTYLLISNSGVVFCWSGAVGNLEVMSIGHDAGQMTVKCDCRLMQLVISLCCGTVAVQCFNMWCAKSDCRLRYCCELAVCVLMSADGENEVTACCEHRCCHWWWPLKTDAHTSLWASAAACTEWAAEGKSVNM